VSYVTEPNSKDACLRRVTGHQVASTTHLSRSIPADHSTNLATAIMEPLSCSTSGLYFLYVLFSRSPRGSIPPANSAVLATSRPVVSSACSSGILNAENVRVIAVLP